MLFVAPNGYQQAVLIHNKREHTTMRQVDISHYNSKWGICGFTSALTHLYESDVRLKNRIELGNEKAIRLALLIEVVTFLKYLKAFRSDLIPGLEKLNKDLLNESMTAGVDAFITQWQTELRAGVKISEDSKFHCALTPEALVLFLHEMCGLKGAALTSGTDRPNEKGILGLYNDTGLRHWVYRAANRNVYNWGKIYTPSEWETSTSGMRHPNFKYVGCHISCP
jgi:hypothetical protein